MKRLLFALLLCGLVLTQSRVLVSAPVAAVKGAQAPVAVKGIVYDEFTNKPIPNLGIYAGPSEGKVTVTNSRGEFSYPVEPGLETVHVLPFSNSIVGKSLFVNVEEFRNKVVKIVVERGMKLRVSVHDTQGKPIAGAGVTWTRAGGCHGKTDKNGIAVIGMVSRFREGTLTVKASDHVGWSRDGIYAPPYADSGINVTLPPKKP